MGITVASFDEGSLRRRKIRKKMFGQAMLTFVLLMPLASATEIVQTDMIDGHYKYKAAPGDGIEDYYGLWGIPAEVVSQFKEEPFVEVWGLNQEGSGFSVYAQRKRPQSTSGFGKPLFPGTAPSAPRWWSVPVLL